ncbi:hypothetical protein TNCV_1318621 [Trichonephila clavipes]|nr:hypothetical protein TNCV_1318621 [Trichonephila clavipes]
MALRNKDSAMNKMSRCRTRNLAPQRRDQKSLENRGRRLGRPRDFCDLPIRRDEGRVVNTPLVFKRVLFEKREKKEEKRRERGARPWMEKREKPCPGWRRHERRALVGTDGERALEKRA